jgi:hypothetical protein
MVSCHQGSRGDDVDRDDPGSAPVRDEEEESVAPARAAQRLHDEMAHAYHEQSALDQRISEVFLRAAVKSLRHEEE